MKKCRRRGMFQRLSEEIYFRRNINRRIVKCKKSWDEINKILNKRNTK